MDGFRYVKTFDRKTPDSTFLDDKWFAAARGVVRDLVSCRTLCLDGAHPYGTGRCTAFVFVDAGCKNWPAKCFLYDEDNHGNAPNMAIEPKLGGPRACGCGLGDGCDTFARVSFAPDGLSVAVLVVGVTQLVLVCVLLVLALRRQGLLGGSAQSPNGPLP